MSEKDDISEKELVAAWREKYGSRYVDVLTEVPVPNSTSGQPRKVDVVAVVTELDTPTGYSQLTREKQKLNSLLKVGKPLNVDVFEVEKYLGPRGIGQILYYARFLPEEYEGLRVRNRGIIYSKGKDTLSKTLAEEHTIRLREM